MDSQTMLSFLRKSSELFGLEYEVHRVYVNERFIQSTSRERDCTRRNSTVSRGASNEQKAEREKKAQQRNKQFEETNERNNTVWCHIPLALDNNSLFIYTTSLPISLGPVYEFVCISFKTDNLNCFRVS